MADHFFGLTDVGRIRTNNEDTFIAQTVQQGKLVLAGVIDGVGGYDGGEIAAEIAREQMIAQFAASAADQIAVLTSAFNAANRHIYQRKLEETKLNSMACVATLAVADVTNNQFYYAHVGDTRLYLFRDQSLIKITKDHSFVGFLEDSGRLTESAAMNHPKRNEINKALGFDHSVSGEKDYIETGQSPFLPGDLLLLCSDGLTDMVDKEEITRTLAADTSLAEKAGQLIAAANRNGGRDNVTVVLVQNHKAPVQQKATMPVNTAVQNQPGAIPSPAVEPEQVRQHQEAADSYHKRSNGLTILFAVLFLLSLAAALWLYIEPVSTTPAVLETQALKPPGKKAVNAQLLKLQDTLSKLKGDTLLLTDAMFQQPLLITDTLKITQDTLYIKTRGNVELKRDSTYAGPAIFLTSSCKHIVIDGLIFQDFTTGILTANNALQLKNVQFINCLYSVHVAYAFPDHKPVTGTISAMAFHADTIIITSPKPHAAK